MSEKVNWTTIGRQFQLLADEQPSPTQQRPFLITQHPQSIETPAHHAENLTTTIRALKLHFTHAVEAFNQGVTSDHLKLVLMGPGDPKFIVVRGSISLAFEKTSTHICQVIQHHRHKSFETQKCYALNLEGNVLVPTGEGTLQLDQVVDLALWELLSTEEKPPFAKVLGH